MDHPIIFILAVIGALYLVKLFYNVWIEWKKEEKDNPLHLDQDTLDQIKLEKEGHYVGWKDGIPVVLPKSNSVKDKKYKYEVVVADNFHYMDESEQYKLGDYESLEDAVIACKHAVDENLKDLIKQYKGQENRGKFYDYYVSFGVDPFIITTDPKAGKIPFSAWNYAKEQCELIVEESNIKSNKQDSNE